MANVGVVILLGLILSFAGGVDEVSLKECDNPWPQRDHRLGVSILRRDGSRESGSVLALHKDVSGPDVHLTKGLQEGVLEGEAGRRDLSHHQKQSEKEVV